MHAEPGGISRQKGETMTNQEILNTLSGLEAALYYRHDGSDDREGVSFSDLEAMHNLINKALRDWNRITGCTLTD